MTKGILVGIGIVAALVVGFFAFNAYIYNEKQGDSVADYKNIAYEINGDNVQLVDGVAETEIVAGSASKTVTRYFGNELLTDLNEDGREDVVFLVTQETGGSGTMFYVVAALSVDGGYMGSDGYFLGDRIAPQNIGVSANPRHKNVIVANYAERDSEDPMVAAPSIGKSAYLKLDTESMQWGIVEPDFEGESR